DIQPRLPPVVPGGQRAPAVPRQIDGLLLACTGTEIECAVLPHSWERRDVRPSLGADRGDPEQLRLLKHLHNRRPRRRLRRIITEPRIKLSFRTHTHPSFTTCQEAGDPAVSPALQAYEERSHPMTKSGNGYAQRRGTLGS